MRFDPFKFFSPLWCIYYFKNIFWDIETWRHGCNYAIDSVFMFLYHHLDHEKLYHFKHICVLWKMLVKWHCNFGDSGLLVIYVKNWHFDLFHEQIVRYHKRLQKDSWRCTKLVLFGDTVSFEYFVCGHSDAKKSGGIISTLLCNFVI